MPPLQRILKINCQKLSLPSDSLSLIVFGIGQLVQLLTAEPVQLDHFGRLHGDFLTCKLSKILKTTTK